MNKYKIQNLFAVTFSSTLTFLMSFTVINAQDSSVNTLDYARELENYLPLIIGVLLIIIGLILIFSRKKQTGFIKTKTIHY